MKNLNSSFLKIGVFSVVDIYKLLWIAVDQRKPRGLNQHQNAVTLLIAMCNVGQLILNLRNLARKKRLMLRKTISELAAEHLTPNQHLVSAHQVGFISTIGKLV